MIQFPNQWGMENLRLDPENSIVDADIDADAAWDVSTSAEDVVVGIVVPVSITTMRIWLPMWVNPNEILTMASTMTTMAS